MSVSIINEYVHVDTYTDKAVKYEPLEYIANAHCIISGYICFLDGNIIGFCNLINDPFWIYSNEEKICGILANNIIYLFFDDTTLTRQEHYLTVSYQTGFKKSENHNWDVEGF